MKIDRLWRLVGLGLMIVSMACGSDSTGDGTCEEGAISYGDDGATSGCCCYGGHLIEFVCVDGKWSCGGSLHSGSYCSEYGECCHNCGPDEPWQPDVWPLDIPEPEPDLPRASDPGEVPDIPVAQDPGAVEDGTNPGDADVEADTSEPADVPLVEEIPAVVDEGTPDQGPPLPELFLGQPIDVSGTEGMQSMSSWLYGMAVNHENRVSLIWGGKPQASSDMKLYISQSNETVEAFGDPIVIDDSIPSDADDRKGDIDTVGTDHLILWKDGDANGSVIRFRRTSEADFSGDDVTVFSDNPGVLNYRPYMLRSPDAQNIWVFWQREQSVVVVKSTDGGQSFSGPVPTVVQPTNLEAFTSAAAITPSGRIVVCYHGHPIGTGLGQNSIYCQNSDDGADSFDDPIEISALGSFEGNHGHPSMALGQDNRVHVVWNYNNGQNALKTSSTDGITWAELTALDPLKWMPMVRTGRESLLHLSGFDNTGGIGAPIYLTSPDDGLTMGEPAYLPITPGATVPRHDMVANLTVGYLYICWWEWGGQSKMRVIGIDPYAQAN